MIPVQIPNLQDRELYEVLRKISLLAVALKDILAVGTTANTPTTGNRKFYWNTDTEQLMFYTGSKWIIIG